MRLTPPSKMSNRTIWGTQARISSDGLFNRRPNRPTWYPLSVHQSGVGPSSSICSVEFLADSFVPWLRKKEGEGPAEGWCLAYDDCSKHPWMEQACEIVCPCVELSSVERPRLSWSECLVDDAVANRKHQRLEAFLERN